MLMLSIGSHPLAMQNPHDFNDTVPSYGSVTRALCSVDVRPVVKPISTIQEYSSL